MRAGDLNCRITIQRATISHDTYNQEIQTWADAGQVWAAGQVGSGREFYFAQKLYAETSALFRVRYTEKINSRMRIRLGPKVYEIIAAYDPDGKHEELHIAVKAVE